MSSFRIDHRISLLKEFSSSTSSVAAAELVTRLDSTGISVHGSDESAAATLNVINLLARLFPNIALLGTGSQVHDLAPFGRGTLSDLARRTISAVAPGFSPTPAQQRIQVCVGQTTPGADFYVSSDGWSMILSTSPHQPLEGNGPANVAAGAIAAAQVFRRAIPEIGGVDVGNQPLVWNLLDYSLALRTPLDLAKVDLTCFGGGSVGSSLVYALVLQRATGKVIVVDPDRLTERNRLRYALWIGGKPEQKAHWLERVTRTSSPQVVGQAKSAAEYIYDSNSTPRAVVAAVDSTWARRDITDALSHSTFNAGIEGMRLHVSRHHFGDGLACLYCPYLDHSERLDEVDVYVELTGLPKDRVERLVRGETLSASDLKLLEGLHPALAFEAHELVGTRIQDLLRARLYGQATVESRGMEFAVTAPFVPVMAGAILAAEVLKFHSGGMAPLVNRRVDVDLTGVPTGFQSRPIQDRSGRCLCQDRFRLEEYQRLWNDPIPP